MQHGTFSRQDIAVWQQESPSFRFGEDVKRDSMEIGGESVKCQFEANDQRVKVTPEGEGKTQIFKIRDKNTMVMGAGFAEVTYKRVP